MLSGVPFMDSGMGRGRVKVRRQQERGVDRSRGGTCEGGRIGKAGERRKERRRGEMSHVHF